MKNLLLCGAVLAPAIVCAEPRPADAVDLDPVVVTATRTAEPLSALNAEAIVIGRDEIERAQAVDIAELLRFHAGLEVARNGGPGQVTSVFLRGGESNHTLVLIDGQRLNPATAGGAALQNISPDMVERIEVIKGPRSTLYGSDAIAGVINVITRAPTAPQAAASLRFGADSTTDASAFGAWGDGVSGLSLDADHVDTRGFPTCENSALDRGYRRDGINLRGQTRAGKAQLSARVWDAEGTTEYLDSCDPSFGLHPLSQDYRNRIVAAEASAPLTKVWSGTLSLAQLSDRVEQNEPNALGEYDFVKTLRPTVDWHNRLELSGQRLSFGATWAQDRVDALSFGTHIDERREVGSAFVQDEWTRGSHDGLLAASYVDDEGFGSHGLWNAEYGYAWTSATRLSLAAGTGFRAPDATDRFGFGGNPELDPETSRSYEAGIRHWLTAVQRLELRAFQNDVDDLISVEFDPANDPNLDFGYRAVNIDRYRNRGLELSHVWQRAAWSTRAGMLWQDPEDRSTGDSLLRRAHRQLTLSATRSFGPHWVAADLLAVSERDDVDAISGAPVSDGGYALWNLGLGTAWAGHYRLSARVENLLDHDYATAAGYAQAGRSAWLTLAAQY
jgi:vitamin B12 transporter